MSGIDANSVLFSGGNSEESAEVAASVEAALAADLPEDLGDAFDAAEADELGDAPDPEGDEDESDDDGESDDDLGAEGSDDSSEDGDESDDEGDSDDDDGIVDMATIENYPEEYKAAVRKMNATLVEKKRVEERLAALEAAAQTPPPVTTPEVQQEVASTAQIVEHADTDAVEAFNYALEVGDDQAAQLVTSRVLSHAQSLQAQAAIARDEGDVEKAQELIAVAQRAAALSQEMNAYYSQVQSAHQVAEVQAYVDQSLAPMRAATLNTSLTSAVQKAYADPIFEGVPIAEHSQAIGAWMEQNLSETDFQDEARIIEKAQEAARKVIYGSDLAFIEHVASQRAAVKRPAANKSRATGGMGVSGRKVPGGSSTPAGEGKQISDSILGGTPASRKSGMQILFGE